MLLLPLTLLATTAMAQDDCTDPLAKCVIRAMDEMISDHVAWDNKTAWTSIMAKFFTEDMIYDTNYSPDEFWGNSTGIDDWYEKEHIPYNLAFDNITFTQLIFAAEDGFATTTTYGKGRWKGDIATIPGSERKGEVVTMRIYDFYIMREYKIFYNWMLLDMVEIMYYAGYRVLPKAALPEGWVQPPAAMDGVPAPISRLVDATLNPVSIAMAEDVLMFDLVEGDMIASPLWAADMRWFGPFGIGYAENLELYTTHFLNPLREAFSERQLQVDLVTCEGSYCGAVGWLVGLHTGPWLGEQPTGREVRLRFGMHYRMDHSRGLAVEGYTIFDLPDAFHQMGVDLFARCSEEWTLPPETL